MTELRKSAFRLIAARSGSAAETDRLSKYMTELARLILEANRRINLTADRDPARFWIRHIEDTLRSAAGCSRGSRPYPA